MVNAIIRLIRWLPALGVALICAGFFMAIREQEFSKTAAALTIIGAVLFLLIFARGDSANVKFYANVIVSSVFGLGIVVVIYAIADGRNLSKDFTKAQLHSLAPQSVGYIQSLTGPVKIYGLFNDFTQVPAQAAEELFERYANQSSMLTFEIVDPVKDNIIRKQLDDRFNTEVRPEEILVVNEAEPKEGEERGDDYTPRFKKFRELSENTITNAVIEVTTEKQVKIYSLEGHGEKTLEYVSVEKKSTSISELKRGLLDRAMKVEPLTLRGDVPEDCSILLVAGPTADLFKPEVEAIQRYLEGGGRALIYLDAPRTPGQEMDNWASLLSGWGVELVDDFVLTSRGASLGNAMMSIVDDFDARHDITKDFRQPQMIVNTARALAKGTLQPAGYTVTELIKTDEQSWSVSFETLLQTQDGLSLPAKDKMKAFPLALAVYQSGSDSGTRLVVFGDADSISDAARNQMSWQLTVICANWLAGQEELVNIPPKEIEETALFLKDSTLTLVFVLLVLALPGAIFFGGLSYTMLRRRSQ